MNFLFLVFGLSSIFSSSVLADGITSSTLSFDKTERPQIQGKVIVDLGQKGSAIDPNFYGSHLDSYSAIPDKATFQDLRIGMVRIGGNEYDVFNWKNKLSITKWTGLKELNGFEKIAQTLNSYKVSGIFQINMFGYQPEAEGSSYVLKPTFTPAAAYEMVKYLNGQLKLGITNFSLGNEFGSWHETHSHVGIWSEESGISADEYIEKYIQYAVAIRKAQAEVNGNPNSIQIWGPELSTSWTDWNTQNFTKDCEWSDVKGQVKCQYGNGKFDQFIPYFLYRLSLAENDKTVNPKKYKLLDQFAFHYYANFRTKNSDPNSYVVDANGRQNVAKMLESTRIFNDPEYVNTVDLSSYKGTKLNIIGRLKKWLADYYPNAKLALNEFAVDSDYRTTGYHAIVRPLYLADLLGIAGKEGLSYFNNYVMNGGDSYSPIPWALVTNGTDKTHQYFVHKIFSNNITGTVVKTDDNLGDTLNAYASLNGKIVNLAIVNKSPKDQVFQVYLKNGSTNKVVTYTASGWSVSVLKFDKDLSTSNGLTNQVYGAQEMGIEKDLNYAQ